MNRRIPVILLVLSLAIGGCAHQAGGIAPSTIPLSPGSYTVLGDVYGRDCVWAVLGLIPVTGGNMTHQAVSKALGRLPGTSALINVTADTYFQWWLVVTNTCTEVHGTAVAIRTAVGSSWGQ
jgi:hypothetical protein